MHPCVKWLLYIKESIGNIFKNQYKNTSASSLFQIALGGHVLTSDNLSVLSSSMDKNSIISQPPIHPISWIWCGEIVTSCWQMVHTQLFNGYCSDDLCELHLRLWSLWKLPQCRLDALDDSQPRVSKCRKHKLHNHNLQFIIHSTIYGTYQIHYLHTLCVYKSEVLKMICFIIINFCPLTSKQVKKYLK